MPSKADIRNELKTQTRTLEAHAKVCDFLVETLKNFKVVGSYQALKSEIDLSALHQKLPSLQIVYPKILEQALSFFLAQEFEVNTHKIREPSNGKPVSLTEIDALLIPGRAFDRRGFRLGWGKGYYDRTLKNYSGLKIGIGESNQLLESLPFEDHDVPMDLLVTEKFVLRPLVKRKEKYV